MITQDYTYYRAALKGMRPSVYADEPNAGFYRLFQKNNPDSAASLKKHGDKWHLRLDGKPVEADFDQICEYWVSMAGKPIEYSVYEHRVDEGIWPEDNAKVDSADSITEKLRKHGEKFKDLLSDSAEISTQRDADKYAGYVQESRKLVKEAKEVIKLVKAPVEAELTKLRKDYDGPVKDIEAMQKKTLEILGDYGSLVTRQANDPNYKFAAGQAGDGKTIGLRKTHTFEIVDADALAKAYESEPRVIEAMAKAMVAEAYSMALEHWKETQEKPVGVSVIETYKAV